MRAQSLSRVWLFVTPWTVACQAPVSMGFSRQAYCSGLPFPAPEDLPSPGTGTCTSCTAGKFLTTEPPGKPIWCLTLANFFYRATQIPGWRWYWTPIVKGRKLEGGRKSSWEVDTWSGFPRSLICSNHRGSMSSLNMKGYSCSGFSTGPAGKTASPAKRRRNGCFSTTRPPG